MALMIGNGRCQFFATATTLPLVGGLVYTYQAGTTTAQVTYTDSTLSTQNSNPIILNSRGECSLFINNPIKIVLQDSLGNVIWTQDNINNGSNVIYDSNGNKILDFNQATTPVNNIVLSNANTTVEPKITVEGSDTNIGLEITTVGSGNLNLDGGSTGNVVVGGNSSAELISTNALIADSTLSVTGASTLTGTVSVVNNATVGGTLTTTGTLTTNGALNATDNITANKLTFSPSTQGIVGTVTNDSAGSGYVGEFIDSGIVAFTGYSVSGTVYNATSISLTPGDWDVHVGGTFVPAASFTSMTVYSGISTTTTTLPTLGGSGYSQFSSAAQINQSIQLYKRLSLSTTTTVYLCTEIVTSGTGSAGTSLTAQLCARRVR